MRMRARRFIYLHMHMRAVTKITTTTTHADKHTQSYCSDRCEEGSVHGRKELYTIAALSPTADNRKI